MAACGKRIKAPSDPAIGGRSRYDPRPHAVIGAWSHSISPSVLGESAKAEPWSRLPILNVPEAATQAIPSGKLLTENGARRTSSLLF
jgi:hypothetical protein